ncbi:MAG: hypothetical protein LBH74_07010 [Nitrososphaerota archaeon]|nr:hypothetical protein [Nitrososphaerota archaeon]
MGDGEVWSSGELVPGRYFVTEVLQAGWVISDIVVVDPSGTSTFDLSTGTAFINLQAGTHVTILYQNTEQLHPDCCNKDPVNATPVVGVIRSLVSVNPVANAAKSPDS